MRKYKRKYVIPALVLAVTFVLLRFVLFVGYVPTESMEPTLHRDSFIVGTRVFTRVQAGDIVVFQHKGKHLVKRVAAVGGEIIESYGTRETVPDGMFYALGDNFLNSFDSRYWEEPFIAESYIIAKIVS